MSATANFPAKVGFYRGTFLETEHPFHFAICRNNGEVIAEIAGDSSSTWRSAAKPFQLEACLSLLPSDIIKKLDPQWLALGSGSHSAQPQHIEQLQKLLNFFHLEMTQLQCGTHPPIHTDTHVQMLQKKIPASAMHNNCSGKHAFMLAAAQATGSTQKSYLDPKHPIQNHIYQLLQLKTAKAIEGTAIDGCSLPTFILPLKNMARAYAHLAEAMTQTASLLGSIGRAMNQHPKLVSGDDRLDFEIAKASHGQLLTKVGAGGVLCGLSKSQKLGFALKVTTGSEQARAAATDFVLRTWFPRDLIDPLPASWTQIQNVVGQTVGNIRVHSKVHV